MERQQRPVAAPGCGQRLGMLPGHTALPGDTIFPMTAMGRTPPDGFFDEKEGREMGEVAADHCLHKSAAPASALVLVAALICS
jgi:hypothetical protein